MADVAVEDVTPSQEIKMATTSSKLIISPQPPPAAIASRDKNEDPPPTVASILQQTGNVRPPGRMSGSGPYLPPPPTCSCPSTVNTACETVKYFQCPVCLAKFDSVKVPVGLRCFHTLCIYCVRLLVPGSCGNMNALPSIESLDLSVGLPNVALLSYLDQPVEPLLSGRMRLDAGNYFMRMDFFWGIYQVKC